MPAYAVIIRGVGNREEFTAGGVITPGQLLEIDSSDDVIRHNSAGADAYPLFALENDTQGDDIDDDYASGEQVHAVWCGPGVGVNALLADGESVTPGAYLISNGDGDLKAQSSIGETAIAIARETLDLSGSSAADPASKRLAVSIIPTL